MFAPQKKNSTKIKISHSTKQQAFFLLPHHWSKFRIFRAKWEMCCAVHSVHSHITLPVTQVNCCCALLSAGSTTGSCRVIFSVLLSTGSHWYRTVTAVLLLTAETRTRVLWPFTAVYCALVSCCSAPPVSVCHLLSLALTHLSLYSVYINSAWQPTNICFLKPAVQIFISCYMKDPIHSSITYTPL